MKRKVIARFYRNSNALVNNVTYTTGNNIFKKFTVEVFEYITTPAGNYFD